MVRSTEVKHDIKQLENNLISLKKFQLQNLKNVLKYLNDKNWNAISFNIELSKEEADVYRNRYF